jgi:hypothetical protein
VKGGVPSQVPSLAVSVCPSRGVPEMAGGVVFEGEAGLTDAVAENALAEPAAFLAVTRTRTRPATSATVSVYDWPVAPGMSAQLAPARSQRCHW